MKTTLIGMGIALAALMALAAICISHVPVKLNDETAVSEVPIVRQRNVVRPFSLDTKSPPRIEVTFRHPHGEMKLPGMEPNAQTRDYTSKQQAEMETEIRRQLTGPEMTIESDRPRETNVILCGK